MKNDGVFELLPKKEAVHLEKMRIKLLRNLSGIRTMEELPDVVYIIDTKKEEIAAKAKKQTQNKARKQKRILLKQ